MVFYISNLLLIFGTLYVFRKNVKIMGMIAFLWLFLLSALRAEGIGDDYYSYQELYELFLIKDYRGYEPLYILLNYLCAYIGGYRSVVVLVAGLSLIGPVFYTVKHSKYPIISLWLYITISFFVWTFTIYRQAIAISFILIAYSYAQEKKIFKFLLFVLIAAGFHNLSIFFVLIYPILNFHWIKCVWQYISIISIAIFFVFRNHLLVFIQIVQKMLGGRFVYYDLNNIEKEGESLAAAYLIVFLIIMLISNKNSLHGYVLRVYSSLMVLCQMIATVFPLANRMGLFFAVPTFLLLPNIWDDVFEAKSRRTILSIIMLISLFYYIFYLHLESITGSSIVPYRFIWQGEV